MNSFEWNKIFGAILGTFVFLMATTFLRDWIFHRPRLEKPGYALPMPEASGSMHEAEAAALPQESLAQLLAKADIKKGESLVQTCKACHDFAKGGQAKIGPPLYGVLGRPMASIADFSYSAGLKGKGETWTFENLDHFLRDPKAYIKGTKMAYAGEKDPARRAAILLYLHSLGDHSEAVPLPSVESK